MELNFEGPEMRHTNGQSSKGSEKSEEICLVITFTRTVMVFKMS